MATNLETLKTLFAFTQEDLNANRKGRLSRRQKKYILQELDASCIGLTALAFTFPVLFLSVGGFLMYLPDLWVTLQWRVILAVLAWLLLTVVISYAFWQFVRWTLWWFSGWDFILRWLCRGEAEAVLLVHEGIVARYSGRLTFSTDEKRTYAMINNEIAFSGTMIEEDARIFEIEPDADYIIYFIPEFYWIASIEPMP